MKHLYATCPKEKFEKAREKHEGFGDCDNIVIIDDNCTVYLQHNGRLSCEQFGSAQIARDKFNEISRYFKTKDRKCDQTN